MLTPVSFSVRYGPTTQCIHILRKCDVGACTFPDERRFPGGRNSALPKDGHSYREMQPEHDDRKETSNLGSSAAQLLENDRVHPSS